MEFKKYSHSGLWLESLQIFLFSELLHKGKDPVTVGIDDYKLFELTDHLIQSFDAWVEEGASSAAVIIEWTKTNPEQVEHFKNGFGSDFKPKVELWSDRRKNDYYKENLQAAFEFEAHLEKYFKDHYGINLYPYLTPEGQYQEGENKTGIEIKYDKLYKKTGNLYIEFEEKSDAHNTSYIRSGILKDDKSKYFLIGDYDNFWVFRKCRLIEILKEEIELTKQGKKSLRGISFKTIPTSRGFVYPIRYAQNEALSLDALVKEITGAT